MNPLKMTPAQIWAMSMIGFVMTTGLMLSGAIILGALFL